jgi:hypothetical protein
MCVQDQPVLTWGDLLRIPKASIIDGDEVGSHAARHDAGKLQSIPLHAIARVAVEISDGEAVFITVARVRPE